MKTNQPAKSTKISSVVWESLDTKIMVSSFLKLREKYPEKKFEFSVLVADVFQVNWEVEKRYLDEINQIEDFHIITLDSKYKKWANPRYFAEYEYDALNSKLLHIQSELPGISSGILFSSNLHFSEFERKPFFKKFSKKEKEIMFVDTFLAVREFLDFYTPDFLFIFATNYLSKNIAAHYAKKHNLNLFTFVRSRFGDYWHCIDGFPIENCSKLEEQEKELFDDLEKTNLSELYDEIYKGLTSSKSKQLKNGIVVNSFKHINSFLSFSIKRSFRLLKYKRISSFKDVSEIKRFIFEFFKMVRLLRFEIFREPYPTSKFCGLNYFFYPLHARPEAGTLTLGRGTDDEEAIGFICRRLPIGTWLVVKENPMMISTRQSNFYRNLIKRHKNLIFCKQDAETKQLILNSLGVVGISGTALLEAAILSKPSFALGYPEFKFVLNGGSWDELEGYLVSCTNRSIETQQNKVFRYYDKVIEQGISLNINNEILKDREKISEAAEVFSKKLNELINSEI